MFTINNTIKNRENMVLSFKKIFSLTLLFLIFFALSFNSAQAQATKGKISGKLVDAENGMPLIYANVRLEGTMFGAASDLDGNYIINAIPAGNYTVIVQYMGYSDFRINDVKVNAGEVTKINASLKPAVLQSEEVVVTAKALKNTESVLLKERQKAVAVSDAISAEAISKAGSGNAAEAMKQITGASVVDGKHIYVRGLGDRYTSTQLNGAEIPSADPYKRAGSIDLIPSNLVDNIVTVKTFTPDKPGNFSGGTVDIKTKDFPDELNLKLTISSSYNTQTTFKENGPIGYASSGTDWLGWDDGARDVPSLVNGVDWPSLGAAMGDDATANELDKMVRSFNLNMTPHQISPPLNQSYGLSVGNQVNFLNRPLGFLGSLTYSRNYSSYDDGQYNAWNLGSSQATELSSVFSMNDVMTKDEVLWGGLFKTSYKINPVNVLSFNFIYNVNGESSARYLEGQYDYDRIDEEDDLFQSSIMGYNERRLTSFQLSGEHTLLGLNGTRVSWKASNSESNQDEPDIRYFTRFKEIEGDEISYGTFSNIAPQRIFRELNETKQEANIDISVPFRQWAGKQSTFKFGTLFSQKDRDFSEGRYVYKESENKSYNGNPEDYFSESNVGLIGETVQVINGTEYRAYKFGLYLKPSDVGVNDYDGTENIAAYYAMLDLPILDKLRFIGGARFENTDMEIISLDETKEDGDISTEDVLPSFNLIYNLKENMNIRAAFTRTLARPNFRELAPYATYDFSAGFTHIGNPNLKRTLINNYDIRWEWFSRPGEIYAISGFYKQFKNPIERSFIILASNREITWDNVDKAEAMGLELELRKRLDVISEDLRDFSFGSNLSLVYSKIDIEDDELKLMRLNNPDAEERRPLEGQSPYLVNVNLNYENYENGVSASLYYNIFGRRLSEVNKSGEPYVYEQPAGTLNASLNWKFMPNMNLKLAAKNLLNSEYKKTQEFKDKEYIFKQYTSGLTFSVGIGYSL